MCKCAICNKEISNDEKRVVYDGDECHLKCTLEDQDAIGMDSDFGDN